MLENFSDEEIATDLLDTGYLYLDMPDGKQKRIDTCAAGPMASIDRTDYEFKEDGKYSHQYLSLKILLTNEGITFDDIRANWKYHGVLLGKPKFAELLVHDQGCPCCLCEKPKESTHHPFMDWCQLVVGSDSHVIIDTETTGLGGEVIDLAAIDMKGNVIYNALLKPMCDIEPKAEATHHISMAMLASAPTIAEEWPRICDIVANRTVITYNATFDSARISYSLEQHGINTCDACQWEFECAMIGYAEFWGAPPKWEGANRPWQSLSKACYQQGIMLPPGLHRAMPDCQATLKLLCKIAATGENSPRYSLP